MVLFFAVVDYYVYDTVPCCFFFFVVFGLFLVALFLSPFALELKYEVGVWVKLLDEHCSFASSTVCINCGFALYSFYGCHCVPLFVHAERINYCYYYYYYLRLTVIKVYAHSTKQATKKVKL